MRFSEYIIGRLDAGEKDTMVQGLRSSVFARITRAPNLIPREDWHAEVTNRSSEGNGQTIIWLAGQPEPSYSIQE